MIHIPKFLAKFLILLLLLSMMTMVAGISWLKAKPRTIPGMDISLNRIIQQQGWPFTVKFGKVYTRWENWDTPLTLEVADLSVTDNGEVYALTVPRAVVKFRVLPLLRGKVRFRHVILSQPTLEWKIEPAEEPKNEMADLGRNYASQWKILQRNPVYLASLNTVFRLLENPNLLPIRRLEAVGATINLALPEETRTIKRSRIVVQLRDYGEGNELRLSSVEQLRDASAYFNTQILKDSKDILWAKTSVENFSTDWIGTASPELAWYSNLKLSFTGQVNAFIQRSGRLEQADFDFRSTPRSSLQFTLSGGLKNQPLFQEYTNIPDIGVRLELENLPVDRIAAYWPLDIGVNARSWVTQNLTKGVISLATMEVKLPPGFWITGNLPVDGLQASVPFERMDVRLSSDLPPVVNSKGTAEFTRDTMHITLSEGALKNSIIQSGATITVPNLGGDELEQMHIKVKTKGPVSDLLSFYDIQQQKLGKATAFDATKAKGDAISDVTIHFPLLQSLQITDIDYTVQSQIDGFDYTDIVPKTSLTGGKFTLDYKDKTMRVEGTGALNGVDSRITYTASNKENRKTDADILISNTVNAEELPKLGFPALPGATGEIAMDYHMQQQADIRNIVITMNARDTTLFYPAVGFHKPAKEPLSIVLNLSAEGEATPTLKHFQADGNTIKARGTSEFDTQGNLKEILLETLVFGRNDGQLKISREGNQYLLQVAAQTLNLEPLIRYYSNSKNDDSSDDTIFTLKGTSKTVLMANGENFTNVAGDLTCLAEKCTAANLSAKTGDGANLTISLLPGEKESVLSINTENAGAVLRGLDIMKDIRGGVLTSRATADAKIKDAPFTGNIIIKDFRIVGTPILARLLTLGSFGGILDTLNGKGIAFTKLDGRYTYGNHTYQLNDFKLYGSALGILVNGYANLKDSLLKLSGTLIPAYALNNAIGQVPIVGNLLGKGVLATSFSVEGKLDDPKTQVYPLSTLAPGIIGDFARDLGILPADKVKQPPAPAPKK